MIAGIRRKKQEPPKETVSKQSSNMVHDNTPTECNLDDICATLNISLHENLLDLGGKDLTAIDDALLRINVGGVSYVFRRNTILRRSADCILSKLCHADTQEERLRYCHGYMERTDEFYYERSPYLFDTIIFQYITNGICHRPANICVDVYVAELNFWNIKQAKFSHCCLDDDAFAADKNLERQATRQSLYNTHRDAFHYLKYGDIRRVIWNLLEVPESSALAHFLALFSLLIVVFATAIMVAASVPELQVHHNETQLVDGVNKTVTVSEPLPILVYTEDICIVFFTIEYLTKVIVSPHRMHTVMQILNLVDLVAIVPFYIELFIELVGIDLAKNFNGAFLMMRVLRVSRVIRIFKLGRYSSGLRAFARTLSASKKQLSMLGVVLTTGVMFFSALVYNLEKDAPDTKFKSIPDAFWWCIVTMTTVGYGDMYPTTTMGKLVGSGAIACGVLVLALPITIIVDNFMQVHETDLAETAAHSLHSRLAIHAENQKNLISTFVELIQQDLVAKTSMSAPPEESDTVVANNSEVFL